MTGCRKHGPEHLNALLEKIIGCTTEYLVKLQTYFPEDYSIDTDKKFIQIINHEVHS